MVVNSKNHITCEKNNFYYNEFNTELIFSAYFLEIWYAKK
jgi:hypothetical protein